MLSNKLSVSILTILLKKHGIKDIIICPGSRNIPLVNNFTGDSFFNCKSITDERSAAFFACGLALKNKAPVVVCCTSGSAVLNMHSAISEAYYQKIPLIVISADRAKAWIDQLDGQTLPQHPIFNNLVKSQIELPQISNAQDKENIWHCNRIVNECLAFAKLEPFAPVHINVPISDPFFSFELKEQDIPTNFFDYISYDNALNFIQNTKRRLLIIGQNQYTIDVTQLKNKLEANFVIFNEHIANIKGLSCNGVLDLILLNESKLANLNFDVIVSLGGHIISKRLKLFLRKQNCPHIQISLDHKCADTFMNLRYKVNTDKSLNTILTDLAAINTANDTDLSNIKTQMSNYINYDFNYSHMYVLKHLFETVDKGVIHLANSSTVRYAEFFSTKENVTIQSNRGVNGIDGSISTALGYACDNSNMNYIVTGDLSFFYDMSALWQENIKNNVKIILINNQGGEIFYAIKGLSLSDNAKHFVIADHKTKACNLCQCFDFNYYHCHDNLSFEQNFSSFIQDPHKALLECFIDKDQDILILKEFFAAIS